MPTKLAPLLACLWAGCAAPSAPAVHAPRPEGALHVGVGARPVRGADASALQAALDALHRELALPVAGDGRLAELARRVPPDAPPEQLRAVAAELGLVDGHLSVHQLPRGTAGSWSAHARERLRAVLAQQRPTHYCAAVVTSDQARVVYGRRPSALEPVPRRFDVGQSLMLRGRLPAVAGPPVVEVFAPDGAYRALPAGSGPDFEVQLPLAQEGTYRVVVASASAQQRWAWLSLHAGRPSEPAAAQVGGATVPGLGRLYARLEALRRAQGRAVLLAAPELERVAAGGARLEGQLVLRGRVRAPDLPGLMRALEHDPACRAALEHADVTHVGVYAVSRGAGLELSLVTARLPSAGASELSAARLLEAINRNRRARGAEPLAPDARLGAVARSTVAAHLRGELASEEAMVSAANAQLERFSLAHRRVAAVVARVADPAEASAWEPALDGGATVVGVGIARLGAAMRAEGKPFLVVLALGWGR